MASGPRYKWIKIENKKILNTVFLLSIFLFSLVYLFTRSSNLIINLLLFFSIYLILQSIFDFYENSKNGNVELSRGLSHLGFGF